MVTPDTPLTYLVEYNTHNEYLRGDRLYLVVEDAEAKNNGSYKAVPVKKQGRNPKNNKKHVRIFQKRVKTH